MKKQYRLVTPPDEFWEALTQVRNYLLQDEAFFWFCCLNALEHPLADAFWCIDAWHHAAWLSEDQKSAQG